ncbi:MAG: hypothetical protein OXE77_03670 [Flavobacteriaceae bacterium]|nr:hypothetical protein [Flavobacteriaceae bacterium]MCY4266649.1 hypothetical protein [Flavobacteriaceae bacterium]MCY4299784.1 hypothetical protein [Flavobacteriaceae bacterium]
MVDRSFAGGVEDVSNHHAQDQATKMRVLGSINAGKPNGSIMPRTTAT